MLIAVTPATNTLAIRRLSLEVGSSESIIAAWVKFPDLTVQPLSQRYTLSNVLSTIKPDFGLNYGLSRCKGDFPSHDSKIRRTSHIRKLPNKSHPAVPSYDAHGSRDF
jgi:hypothetical protein